MNRVGETVEVRQLPSLARILSLAPRRRLLVPQRRSEKRVLHVVGLVEDDGAQAREVPEGAAPATSA
jgi:hypothetical protein